MSDATLNLPPQVGIDVVEDLYEEMKTIALDAEKVIINCEDIDRVDFCGIQLLVAFVAELSRGKVEISWIGVNDVLANAVSETNFQSELGISAA